MIIEEKVPLDFKLEQLELEHMHGRLLLGLASLYKA